MAKNQNKALWIFPNFLETINELPEKQRADVWRAICEYGLGCEIDIEKFKTSQKMAIKMLLPLLKLRNTGGSVKEGEVRNKTGNNQFIKLSNCNNNKSEDNPYPTPEDNHQDNRKDNPEDNSLITRTRTINKKEIYKEKFEVFWSLYPKQRAGSKQKAYNSFVKAIQEKRTTPDWLIESVKKYAESKVVKDGYAKGCSAWLNDDRFNDEYKDVAQSDTPQRKKFVVQYDLEEISREITPEEVMIPAAYVGVK